ncbi:MAG: hypothetical protein ABGW74_06320 [Campylobacterales bacterium]
MKKNVDKITNGVKISFSGEVKKQNIVTMVKNMQVLGDDGAVELKLTGDISKEEIEEALKKSKVLNK